MSVEAFRIWNFMGFEDSDWIELRPINLLFGRHSTGKSSILRALLLLRQSLASPPTAEPLTLFSEDGINAGSWEDIVHRNGYRAFSSNGQSEYQAGTVAFGFSCRVDPTLLTLFQSQEKGASGVAQAIVPSQEAWATVRLAYRQEHTSQAIILQGIAIYLPWINGSRIEDDSTLLFEAEWTEEPGDGRWLFKCPILEPPSSPHLTSDLSDALSVTDFGRAKGFLPRLPRVVDKSEAYEAIRQLLEELRNVIIKFLTSIHYLGPLRSQSRRLYYLPRASQARRWGTMEHFLSSWGTPEWEEKKKAINARLAELELGIQFDVRPLHDKRAVLEREKKALTSRLAELGLNVQLVEPPSESEAEPLAFEVILKEAQATTSSNLSDSGFGWSQMLSFVVQSVLAEEGATIIIEEPEAHLHPGAQAQLGNLFVKMARQGVRFLLETHSEHLLIRLRRWVAETSSGRKTLGNHDEYLEEEELGLYFINRDNGVSIVDRIEVGLYGELLDVPEGFEGFFADDLREMAALSRARLAY